MVLAASVLAQTTGQFRDERTGKVWTPETVSQDNKLAAPTSERDKAFDPRSQMAVVEGVTVQRPRASLMGVLPITAGPSVPIVTLDGASLQAVPGERLGLPVYGPWVDLFVDQATCRIISPA